MALRIPKAVEEAVLANRAHFRELDRKARERSGGTMGFTTRPEALGDVMAFWEIADDDALDDVLNDDLLSALYGNVDPATLPAGYAPLLDVLEFERHCQFEGWTAVGNREGEMPAIIESYRRLGLADEARALAAVFAAYAGIDHDDEGFHEALGKAYRSVPNATPDIEDRIPIVLNFVRANPELFGEAA